MPHLRAWQPQIQTPALQMEKYFIWLRKLEYIVILVQENLKRGLMYFYGMGLIGIIIPSI